MCIYSCVYKHIPLLFSALIFPYFILILVMGWNSLDCMSVEYYPTSSRASAMGVLASAGRYAYECICYC